MTETLSSARRAAWREKCRLIIFEADTPGGKVFDVALILMIVPRYRNNEKLLRWGCITVFVSLWIDKGLGMVVSGFIPSQTGHWVQYTPTFLEILMTLSIYAIGFLIITVLYKVALEVRHQIPKPKYE